MATMVMLTYGNPYAYSILQKAKARGLRVDGIIICSPPASQSPGPIKWLFNLKEKYGIRGALARSLTRARTGAVDYVEVLRPYTTRLKSDVMINGVGMLTALREMKPDYVLLGELGIVSDQVLKVPRVGTLNVHPGLLPYVRGTGVVGRALERGYPIGATAHWVDPGVDTGAIIKRGLVLVDPSDTLEDLERLTNALCVDLMVHLMEAIDRGDTLPREPQTETYPICRWMNYKERRALDRQIKKERLAYNLYMERGSEFEDIS